MSDSPLFDVLEKSSVDPDAIVQVVAGLAHALTIAKRTLTVAESCTGGYIAKSITDLPGSSAWFEYGFTAYSNKAKVDLLGVPSGQIEAFGAVSKEVAEAMAIGALRRSGADIALAVTGIAGPDGGSAEKPVGTVWFAWASKQSGGNSRDGHVITLCKVFNGNRQQVREQTVLQALEGALKLVAA